MEKREGKRKESTNGKDIILKQKGKGSASTEKNEARIIHK
jgi:hypothetical protein